jgi:ABC-type glycerol-3-phosphate transport system substrate-binding protein
MKARRSALWYVATCTLLLGMALSAASLAAPKDVQFVVYSSEERVPLYQENFDAFKAKTGIGVEHQQVPGSQVQKWEQVITRIAGGLSPDVIGAVSVEFVQYAANGLILPVDEWIKKDKVNTRAIIPILVDALQWRGQQYMMPYGASGLPLVYNAQLFDEAGAAYPPEVWGKREWNWETFVSTLRKLTKKDSSGNITQYGLGGPPWDSWITLPYTWGGDWIDSRDEAVYRYLARNARLPASHAGSAVELSGDGHWRRTPRGTLSHGRMGNLEPEKHDQQPASFAHGSVVYRGYPSSQRTH